MSAPHLYIGFDAGGVSLREAVALGLVAEMLGAPESGRISRLLVRGRHRATTASARLECIRGTPLLTAHVVVAAHSSIDRVDRYVVSTLGQLRIAGPSDAELARARRRFATRTLLASERPVDRARRAAEWLACGLPDTLGDLLTTAETISASDVQDTVRRFLSPTRRSVVEIYPPGWPQDDQSLRAYRLHTVAEGETWSDVAKSYGVSAATIAAANELHTKYRLGPGQILWIPPERVEPTATPESAQAARAPSAPSRR